MDGISESSNLKDDAKKILDEPRGNSCTSDFRDSKEKDVVFDYKVMADPIESIKFKKSYNEEEQVDEDMISSKVEYISHQESDAKEKE